MRTEEKFIVQKSLAKIGKRVYITHTSMMLVPVGVISLTNNLHFRLWPQFYLPKPLISRSRNTFLGNIIDQHVPEEIRDSFEFHASELWNCRPPFEKLKKEQAVKIIEQCFDAISMCKLAYQLRSS